MSDMSTLSMSYNLRRFRLSSRHLGFLNFKIHLNNLWCREVTFEITQYHMVNSNRTKSVQCVD